jgi:hypothetical protein
MQDATITLVAAIIALIFSHLVTLWIAQGERHARLRTREFDRNIKVLNDLIDIRVESASEVTDEKLQQLKARAASLLFSVQLKACGEKLIAHDMMTKERFNPVLNDAIQAVGRRIAEISRTEQRGSQDGSSKSSSNSAQQSSTRTKEC